jgi:hypothetical protein
MRLVWALLPVFFGLGLATELLTRGRRVTPEERCPTLEEEMVLHVRLEELEQRIQRHEVIYQDLLLRAIKVQQVYPAR